MAKRCIPFIALLVASITVVVGARSDREELAAAPLTGVEQGGGQGRGGGGGAGGPIPSIEDRTTGMRKIDGYFPLYWDDRTGSMFLEIPKMNQQFLMATG